MMGQVSGMLFWALGLVAFLGLGGFALTSHREGEQRAARCASLVALGGGALFVGAAWLPPGVQWVILGLLVTGVLVGVVLFILPIARADLLGDTPRSRFDERDIMFARARLRTGSPEYQAYYQMRPENKAGDDLTRSRPGLLSLQATFADPFLFASAQGSFALTGALRVAVDGPVASEQHTLPPAEMTAYITSLAKYYGALEAGVAQVQPYHVYSHIGRGTGEYGAPIPLEHAYAIAFAVEMDFAMIGANPRPPGVMESARQYVEAARVAVPLAAAIRDLGYPARAHIDGNYQVIAPLVARDAGLGEIGRMGLLMTPRQGPRVRLGVVTTNMPLEPAGILDDPRLLRFRSALIDFCTICKKCAVCCPSRSIPFDDRQEIDGALRWRIDADTCFHYWNVVGTDCGRCMTVCPYSHPDSFYHNIVRWGVARSGAFRRVALWLDDLFYGRKPVPRDAPRWTQVG